LAQPLRDLALPDGHFSEEGDALSPALPRNPARSR
jgi:hypothetical protein